MSLFLFLNTHRTSDSFSSQSLLRTAFILDGFCGELPLSLTSLAICEACTSFSYSSLLQKSGGKADTCYRNAILPCFWMSISHSFDSLSAERVFKLLREKTDSSVPSGSGTLSPWFLNGTWMSGVEHMLKLDQGDLLADVKAESERTTWDGLTAEKGLSLLSLVTYTV